MAPLNHEPSKKIFGAIFKMVLVNREFKIHVNGKCQIQVENFQNRKLAAKNGSKHSYE